MFEKLINRTNFKLLFIFYVFINTLALGYFGIQTNPLYIVVFIYGAIVLLYDLLKKEVIYSKNHLILIFLYEALLCIATYYNKTYSDKTSYIIAVMQMFIFLLIFAQPRSMTLKKLKKELKLIIPFVSVLVGAASLISLGMYFLNISSSRNGWYLGLVGTRLFGIYFNCNPASFLAVITVLLSLIAISNQYRFRILYIANIGIQLGYIILTQCRAAILILAIVSTAVIYYYFFRAKEFSKLKRITLNIVLCLSILFGTAIINKVAYIIPQLQGASVKEESRFQFQSIQEIIELTMSGNINNIPKIIQLTDQVTSGRITLAKDSIKVWQKDPLHGIGAGNFRKMLIDQNEASANYGQQILHSHNVFLETLVTAGIFGFAIFFLFFIKTMFVTRDILNKYKNKRAYFIILLFIMIFLSEFIGGFFDFGVFYVYSLSATLAWMFLGYTYWLNDQPDMPLVDHSQSVTFNRYELISIQYRHEDIERIKPEFVILNTRDYLDDYIIQVQYMLGKSTFIYDLYYSLNKKKKDNEVLNKTLVKEFYPLIEDEIKSIYAQSEIK